MISVKLRKGWVILLRNKNEISYLIPWGRSEIGKRTKQTKQNNTKKPPQEIALIANNLI